MALYDGRQEERYRFNPYDSAVIRDDTSSTFLNGVYRHMALGLGVTGLVAMAASKSSEALGVVAAHPYLLMGAQLAVAFSLIGLVNRISATTAMFLFYLYSALTGFILSTIFLVFDPTSIATTFFVTAGTFGGMSLYGYTTKRDLTGFGNFLLMGLMGIILATVVNMFFASSLLTWIVTYIGLFIFIGLTAYDTQRIRNLSASLRPGEDHRKLAIQGALILYLDFVNMFLYLLEIFGKRRED